MSNASARPKWHNAVAMDDRSFTCGFCGNAISSVRGYYAVIASSGGQVYQIYLCHLCDRPTFFDHLGRQTPGALPGTPVKGLTDSGVSKLYEEARSAFSANAHTAVVMCCRTLLMHIAVDRGASEGAKFEAYVDYLSENNHIGVGSRPWVDRIRTMGNAANHKIVIATPNQSKEILDFTEMLLKIIYEYPSRVPQDK